MFYDMNKNQLMRYSQHLIISGFFKIKNRALEYGDNLLLLLYCFTSVCICIIRIGHQFIALKKLRSYL